MIPPDGDYFPIKALLPPFCSFPDRGVTPIIEWSLLTTVPVPQGVRGAIIVNNATQPTRLSGYLRVNIQKNAANEWEATAEAIAGDPPYSGTSPTAQVTFLDHDLPQPWQALTPVLAAPADFDTALLEARGKAEADFLRLHPGTVVHWKRYPRARVIA
jgi:hypothetical protein